MISIYLEGGVSSSASPNSGSSHRGVFDESVSLTEVECGPCLTLIAGFVQLLRQCRKSDLSTYVHLCEGVSESTLITLSVHYSSCYFMTLFLSQTEMRELLLLPFLSRPAVTTSEWNLSLLLVQLTGIDNETFRRRTR